MKDIAFTFVGNGETTVDKKAGATVPWDYHVEAVLRLHEETETWSCTSLSSERMSLNDLKRKLRQKFSASARAEARQRYVERMDAERRALALIGARPMAVDELVR